LDIEDRAEVLGGDRGAFDMPAGPAAAERRVPGRLAGPFRPPDQAIERILLPRPVRIAAALRGELGHLHRTEFAGRAGSRQQTEPRVCRLREVDILIDVVQGTPVRHLGAEPLDDGQRLNRPD